MDTAVEIKPNTKDYNHILVYPGLDKSMDVFEAIVAENPLIPLPLAGSTIYERVHSYFWKGSGNFVWSVSKSNPQVFEDYNISLETDFILQLTKGLKLNVIADISGAAVQTKKERDSQNKEHSKIINSLAMITRSPLMRMAANLFINLNAPIYPAHVFTKVESATEWMQPHASNSDVVIID